MSLRNRNAHGHVTRAILCENLQEKCCAPKSRRTNWSLRGQNRHGHLTRTILCENLHEKCRVPTSRGRLCASLRSQNAHGHLPRAILCYGEKTGSKSVPGSTAGLNTFRKNPSVRPHCLRKKELPRPILLVGREASLLWVKQIQQQSARQQYDSMTPYSSQPTTLFALAQWPSLSPMWRNGKHVQAISNFPIWIPLDVDISWVSINGLA